MPDPALKEMTAEECTAVLQALATIPIVHEPNAALLSAKAKLRTRRALAIEQERP